MAAEELTEKSDSELLALALDFLYDTQDEGPLHAGWKSDPLLALISEIERRTRD